MPCNCLGNADYSGHLAGCTWRDEKAITRDTLPAGWVWCAPCGHAYPPWSIHAAANNGDTN